MSTKGIRYSAIDRFLVKVEWGENRYQGTRCLIWVGAKRTGYGVFWDEGLQPAHRWLYERWVGPVPEGMEMDHLCHIPGECNLSPEFCPHRPCVNPAHLTPATRRDNTLRSNSQSAIHARKTHCAHGHEFTEENTAYRQGKNGRPWRVCKECSRRYAREERQRARESK